MARVMGSGCGVTGQPAQVAMCSGVTLQVCFGTCGTVCAGMAMGVPGCVQVCTSAPGGYTWLGGGVSVQPRCTSRLCSPFFSLSVRAEV